MFLGKHLRPVPILGMVITLSVIAPTVVLFHQKVTLREVIGAIVSVGEV